MRWWYWVHDAVTDRVRDDAPRRPPDPADLWRVMKNTLQLVLVAEILVHPDRGWDRRVSAIRQYSPFDYTATTFSFIGLAMPVFGSP